MKTSDALRAGDSLVVRPATVEDYAAFARLFPEMLSSGFVPGPEIWASVFVPLTLIAESGGEVLGYCYCHEYEDTGYVRNVVVAPSARRRGVGRALMDATAARLRAHGKTSWRLNVKPDNRGALALYARVGLEPRYSAISLRLPWSALGSLPASNAVVRDLSPDRDRAIEALFALPFGQLAFTRGLGLLLFEALSSSGDRSLGLAVFDPKWPGALPFRMTELGAVTPLLRAMRRHVPHDDQVNLVAEDDERLVKLLLSVGASVSFEILHLIGALSR